MLPTIYQRSVLPTHHPSCLGFSHLCSNIVMPAMSCLSITLPPAPGRGAGARPAPEQQPELVTVEAIVDSIEVMASLQKPKKVRGTHLGGPARAKQTPWWNMTPVCQQPGRQATPGLPRCLLSQAGLETSFSCALPRPRQVTFVGSDGAHYTFLAKPKDDLRKDNRMMEAAGGPPGVGGGGQGCRRGRLAYPNPRTSTLNRPTTSALPAFCCRCGQPPVCGRPGCTAAQPVPAVGAHARVAWSPFVCVCSIRGRHVQAPASLTPRCWSCWATGASHPL